MGRSEEEKALSAKLLGRDPSLDRQKNTRKIVQLVDLHGLGWLVDQAFFYGGGVTEGLTDMEVKRLRNDIELAAVKLDAGIDIDDMRRPTL